MPQRANMRRSFLMKIYLFNKYLLSSYFVPKVVLEKEDKAMKKTEKDK